VLLTTTSGPRKAVGTTLLGYRTVVTVFDQAGFDARLEWGRAGARVLAGVCRVIVVVDVLSFTTAIEVAVGRGAVVFPRRWPDPGQLR
jgi:hypothetical protein